jgi:putative ABC transport system substrate-binding protein
VKRREFITLLGGAAAAGPLAARAQPKRMRRIGVLMMAATPDSPLFRAFREELRKLGHIEGQTVSLEFRSSGGDPIRVANLAAELARSSVEMIVTDGTVTARAAKDATSTIPIVMATVGDPIASGLVNNLARPDGNLTGFTLFTLELSGKRLELLREAFPSAVRIGVLWNPLNSGPQFEATGQAAATLGIAVESGTAESHDALQRSLADLTGRSISALIVLPDALFWNQRRIIIDRTTAERLPAIFPEREYADDGGLLAYGPSVIGNFRRAAVYVDRILKGEKPADLPVQQPTKFELVINLKTAKVLKLEIPPKLLARADEVIELSGRRRRVWHRTDLSVPCNFAASLPAPDPSASVQAGTPSSNRRGVSPHSHT